jgi:hypothetical protein
MKKKSFLKDLARNTAIFLGAGELSGKKDQKQKELDDLSKDLDETADKFAKEAKERIKKMPKEKQERLAKLSKLWDE